MRCGLSLEFALPRRSLSARSGMQLPGHVHASATRARLSLILVLLVPVLCAANPTDLLWASGWFDNADMDDLVTKTISPEGAIGSAELTPAIFLARTALAVWRAACHVSDINQSRDARGPPNAPSVLIRYDPAEIFVYFDTLPDVTSIDTLVAAHACPYLGAEEIPLPVPYTVWVVQRSGESKRYVPKHKPIAKGVLSTCSPR
jgi:hypothetical protein